jgi:PelA/Pel-15E family pectate lyase
MTTIQSILVSVLLLNSLTAFANDSEVKRREEAIATMKRATEFYLTRVASHGGYVYHYSLDLSQRWGEGEATKDQIWVQPPGTPTVGLAYVAAYKSTGDRYYLEAIEEVATALMYGQLKSGGWTNCIDFDPQGARVAQYRNGRGGGKNNSSLDDGQTQTAIRFMIQADAVFEFKNASIHDASLRALDALLAAQFPSGGFPQVWTGPVTKQPIVKANFPEHDYRTEGRLKNYWDMPTLNDNVCVHVAHALRDAHQTYKDAKYLDALKKLGDFLLLAQMPEPQPAWAQQYNHQMQPIWARRFEPPAIAGHESQSVVALLVEIAELTGDKKYLTPLPAAIAYLRRSTLPDGQIARYYELKTNRPLYMHRDGDQYTLTFEDNDLPSHYSWKSKSQVDKLQRQLDNFGKTIQPRKYASQEVDQIIQDLDREGRWITTANGDRLVGQAKLKTGEQFISSAAFSENLTVLADYAEYVENSSERLK